MGFKVCTPKLILIKELDCFCCKWQNVTLKDEVMSFKEGCSVFNHFLLPLTLCFNWSQSTRKTCCHVRCLIVTRIKVTWLIWISYVIFSVSSTTNEAGIVSYLYEGQYQNTIQKLKLDRVFKVKEFQILHQ